MTEEQKLEKELLDKNIEGGKRQLASLRFQVWIAESTLTMMTNRLEELNGIS